MEAINQSKTYFYRQNQGMRLLRLLLFPFSFIYALVVIIRNWAYDNGLLKSRRFKVPVISVGNLSVGGAGKSPMTEYLVGILKDEFKVATLSRGYGRRTKGFLTVKTSSSAEDIGDEPLQFKRKFPEITVAVCEDRVEGIKELNQHHDVIILDDAFQHRAVKPGLSILLFDCNSLQKFQWFLPTGDLRESLSGRKRADLIIITKAPERLPDEERLRLIKEVRPFSHQQVFFSSFQYSSLLGVSGSRDEMNLSDVNRDTHVLLLTGIANPAPLIEHIKLFSANISHHEYPDHHQFTKKNIVKLVREFKGLPATDKIIITTEKDAQRLNSYHLQELLRPLPVYYLPVKAVIQSPDEERFNDLIIEYVRKHPINHRVHKA